MNQNEDAARHYRDRVRKLVSNYVPPGKTIDEELKDLAETWNPLLDPDGRKDLVLDVNSLVRHFMRPVGRSLVDRPLDELRLHALVEQL